MSKQILMTSALILIGAASIQSAAAADATKFRQLVVEPAGRAAGVLPVKKLHLLVAPQPGIPASAGSGQRVELLVAPQPGIPSPSADTGNGNGQSPKKIQLVVAPQPGIPAPSPRPIITANNGQPDRTNVRPLIVTPEATPSADAGAAPADPVDEADATSADPAPADASLTDATATAPIDAPAATSDDSDPAAVAADGNSDDAVAPANQISVADIHSPNDLYARLADRGFDIEVLKRDADGNLVFLVTRPTNHQDGYLLLVDGQYGKVLVKKPIDLADYGYDHRDQPYPAASYTQDSYAYDSDNCIHGSSGYRHIVSRY